MASSKWYDLHYHQLLIDGYGDRWYICWPDGEVFEGPFKRAQDAKRSLTMFKKDYYVC